MPPISIPHQWPRGPTNQLHSAVYQGSAERTLAMLSSGSVDIDRGNPKGWTPLMFAIQGGHFVVARILLEARANVSVVADNGFTALLASAQSGHHSLTEMLVKAGASLEAADSDGSTPLHVAAENGHTQVMRVLIEGGANSNSRRLDGATPLFSAALGGCVDAIRELLRAKANPLLASGQTPSGATFVPLDVAVQHGHPDVVRELIQRVGVRRCGGVSVGAEALRLAAMEQHVDIMGLLTVGGVVDTGRALVVAAEYSREESVKFLLQHQAGAVHGEVAYVNSTLDPFGRTPLICSIEACSSCSPRISRALIDAGADTTSDVLVADLRGKTLFHDNPLAFANRTVREKTVAGKGAPAELPSLNAIRRLLLQVEAVHAVSWLWQSDFPHVGHATGGVSRTSGAPTAGISLKMMLPILRRRAIRRSVLLGAVSRYSRKPQRVRW